MSAIMRGPRSFASPCGAVYPALCILAMHAVSLAFFNLGLVSFRFFYVAPTPAPLRAGLARTATSTGAGNKLCCAHPQFPCLLKWRPQGVQPGQPGGRPEMLPPGRRKHGTRTRLRVHFPAIRRKTASPPQYAAPKDRATCCRAPFIPSEGDAARKYQMARPRSDNGPRKAFNFSKPSRNVFTTMRCESLN